MERKKIMIKITLIHSLKRSDWISEVLDKLNNILPQLFSNEYAITDHTPYLDPAKSIMNGRNRLKTVVNDSDIIIACPDKDGEITNRLIVYELAYADSIGKPVLFWKE